MLFGLYQIGLTCLICGEAEKETETKHTSKMEIVETKVTTVEKRLSTLEETVKERYIAMLNEQRENPLERQAMEVE